MFRKLERIISFSIYFLKKRLSVFLGLHRTPNPLTLKWRWHHWVYTYDYSRKKKKR